MHCARATLSVIATFLGAGKIEMLAQRVEQRRARIECELARCAVDRESDLDFCRARPSACASVFGLACLCRYGCGTRCYCGGTDNVPPRHCWSSHNTAKPSRVCALAGTPQR